MPSQNSMVPNWKSQTTSPSASFHIPLENKTSAREWHLTCSLVEGRNSTSSVVFKFCSLEHLTRGVSRLMEP